MVPLDHGTESVFFLGAYPSSRFVAFGGLTDVPAGDNLGPFESEKVFLFKDGHTAKYSKLGFDAPAGYERARFHELGIESLNILGKVYH